MRGVLNELYPIVAEDELQDALEKVLCDFYEEPVTVTQWHRRVSDYSSSHLIEEIDVRVAGQSELKLIFKDLSRNALLTGQTETSCRWAMTRSARSRPTEKFCDIRSWGRQPFTARTWTRRWSATGFSWKDWHRCTYGKWVSSRFGSVSPPGWPAPI